MKRFYLIYERKKYLFMEESNFYDVVFYSVIIILEEGLRIAQLPI